MSWKTIAACVVLALASGCPSDAPMSGTPSKSPEGLWLESFDAAATKARAEKKLILADFTGSDWCGWCIKLRKEVFDTKEFQDWATKNVVLLEVDFPRSKPQSAELKAQNQKLENEFKIEGYPTIVFMDADKKTKGVMGYESGGPSVWLKKADEIVKK